MRVRAVSNGIVLSLLALAAVGCDFRSDEEFARPQDTLTAAELHEQKLQYGRDAYQQFCVGCHGEKGDGNGEAARFLDPKPRNFQLAHFKFSQTRSGELPTDADLLRTIKYGLKGSAMPPFELLPDEKIEAIIAYLKTFSPRWHERGAGTPIPFVNDPYRSVVDKTDAIRRGEVVYHGYSTCWTCHPAYVGGETINAHRAAVGLPTYDEFRPGLDHSVGKENVEGWMVYPPDFRRDFVRAGASVDDLYRSIAAGITGTAMPTWVDSMDLAAPEGGMVVQTNDLWAMAYYVQDLMRQRPKTLTGQVALRDRPHTIYVHGIPADAARKPATDEPVGEEVEADF